MIDKHYRPTAAMWKSSVGIIMLFAVVKILSRFMTEPLAWAFAGFVMTVFMHLAPPRTSVTLTNVVLLAIAAGLLLLLMTKLIG